MVSSVIYGNIHITPSRPALNCRLANQNNRTASSRSPPNRHQRAHEGQTGSPQTPSGGTTRRNGSDDSSRSFFIISSTASRILAESQRARPVVGQTMKRLGSPLRRPGEHVWRGRSRDGQPCTLKDDRALSTFPRARRAARPADGFAQEARRRRCARR